MTLATYPSELSMRDARDLYFRVNGFGADGGYGDAWVDFKLGPLPCPFPNTASRVTAVKVHDLHHILTAYDTNLTGELEIGAWELGAGCKGFAAAWFLNLGAMGLGLAIAPRRTFRAFVRGRRTDSLYGKDLEAMLDRSVGEMRRETHVDQPVAEVRAADVAAFTAFSVVAVITGLISTAMAIPIVPVGLLMNAFKPSKSTPPGQRVKLLHDGR